MPSASPGAVRKQIAQRTPDPVYLILGDDEAEMSALAAEISALVEDELRAFNVERLYASDRSTTPAAIAEAARVLPMMSSRRVIVVLRAEKILKPKRRRSEAGGQRSEAGGQRSEAGGRRSEAGGRRSEAGGRRAEAGESEEADAAVVDADELERYLKAPVPETVLVFVASDVDRTRRLFKALQKQATIVECWGLRGGRDARVDLRQAARQAEQLVRQAVTNAGQQIDAAAARLVAERAGTDIARLRGDVDRLLLYAAGKPRIALADAQEVVSAEIAQDDWAVTNAIQRGDTANALRHLGLSLEGGAVPYMILGQLAWFVREKLPFADPRRVRPAIEAVFRTDLDLKSSGGDPRVLLERLVVELSRGASGSRGALGDAPRQP